MFGSEVSFSCPTSIISPFSLTLRASLTTSNFREISSPAHLLVNPLANKLQQECTNVSSNKNTSGCHMVNLRCICNTNKCWVVKKDTRTDVVFFFKLIFVLWMRKLYAAQENECTSICRNCALFIHYDIYTHECLFMLLHALLMRCLSPKGICVKEKTPKRNTCIRHIWTTRVLSGLYGFCGGDRGHLLGIKQQMMKKF